MPDIRLLRPHTHAGLLREAGSVLPVDGTIAAWLVAQGVGEAVPSAQAAPWPASPRTRRGTHSAPPIADTDTTGDVNEH